MKWLNLALLTFYSAPSQLAPNSEEQKTRTEKRQESEENGTQRDWEKQKQRKGESKLFRFKGDLSPSFFPSTLIRSLCATLAAGGMGAACHWCHSPVNQRVMGSDGLLVVERKPPAKRHMRWSHHLFMLATKPPSLSEKLWQVFLSVPADLHTFKLLSNSINNWKLLFANVFAKRSWNFSKFGYDSLLTLWHYKVKLTAL